MYMIEPFQNKQVGECSDGLDIKYWTDMQVCTVVNRVERILSSLFCLSIEEHDRALPEQADW
jgi:hypothetical protein